MTARVLWRKKLNKEVTVSDSYGRVVVADEVAAGVVDGRMATFWALHQGKEVVGRGVGRGRANAMERLSDSQFMEEALKVLGAKST